MSRRSVLIVAAVAFTVIGPGVMWVRTDAPVAVAVAPAAPPDPKPQDASGRVYGRVLRIQPQAGPECERQGGQVLMKNGAAVCLWIVTQDGVWRREVAGRPKVRM